MPLLYVDDGSQNNRHEFKVGCRYYWIYPTRSGFVSIQRQEYSGDNITPAQAREFAKLLTTLKDIAVNAPPPPPEGEVTSGFRVVTDNVYTVQLSSQTGYKFNVTPQTSYVTVTDIRTGESDNIRVRGLEGIIGYLESAATAAENMVPEEEKNSVISLVREPSNGYWTATLMGDPSMTSQRADKDRALAACLYEHGAKVNITIDQASKVEPTPEEKPKEDGGIEDTK